jgi:hypothetical protein
LSFHFVNKIFVSFNSVFNILLHTVHTHLLKLEVYLVFKIYENIWLLEFANESDKRRVKDGLFDRCVLALKEVEDSTPPLQMDFTKALFWVQVHDMPLTCMNKEVGLHIGGTLGKVDEVDVMSVRIDWGGVYELESNLIPPNLWNEAVYFSSMANPFGSQSNMKNSLNIAILVVGSSIGRIYARAVVVSG